MEQEGGFLWAKLSAQHILTQLKRLFWDLEIAKEF